MRLIHTSILLLASAVWAGAAGSPLLNRAAEKWLAEGNRWACSMYVREWEGDQLKEERVERYDPSKPRETRWELLSVDGQPPSDERRAAWQKSKARKHRKPPKSLGDFFDLKMPRPPVRRRERSATSCRCAAITRGYFRRTTWR